MSLQERQRHAALWVMLELVATDDRQSLEGRGLLRVDLDREASWRLPPDIAALALMRAGHGLSLLNSFAARQQGAISMPEGVDPRDEAFDPRRGPIYVRADAAEAKRKVISWMPTRGVNRRLDYVTRLLATVSSPADPREVLRGSGGSSKASATAGWQLLRKPGLAWSGRSMTRGCLDSGRTR